MNDPNTRSAWMFLRLCPEGDRNHLAQIANQVLQDQPSAFPVFASALDQIIDQDLYRPSPKSSYQSRKAPKLPKKAKKKTKPAPKAKKTKVTGKKISKPKIDADKFKRGTSQETLEERLKRQAKNREETAVGEEHKQTDEYKETASGTDAKGEYLSPEERKKRFKAKFIPNTGFDLFTQ